MAASPPSSKRRRLDESSSGSHPTALDAAVRRQCDEILSWRRAHGGQRPVQTRDSCEEGRLALRQAKLKCRRAKALGTKPSERQLNQDEVRYYEWCLSGKALHEERPEWRLKHRRHVTPTAVMHILLMLNRLVPPAAMYILLTRYRLVRAWGLDMNPSGCVGLASTVCAKSIRRCRP